MKQLDIQHFRLKILDSEEINAYHVLLWQCKDSYMNSYSIQRFAIKSKNHSNNLDRFSF